MRHFWYIWLQKCHDHENRFRGHRGPSRSLKMSPFDRAPDFLLTFHSNHGPISYCFRDRQWFQSKIAKFSQPRVFCAPAEGVPLGIGHRRWQSRTRMICYQAKKEVWRYIQASGYNPPTWQTHRERERDRRTDTGRQQRQRLRIASRGNNRPNSSHDRSMSLAWVWKMRYVNMQNLCLLNWQQWQR